MPLIARYHSVARSRSSSAYSGWPNLSSSSRGRSASPSMAWGRKEGMMQILRLTSFPIEQVPNLQSLELDLAAWFVARDYPVRLLAYSQTFQMKQAIARVQQIQAGMERIQQ